MPLLKRRTVLSAVHESTPYVAEPLQVVDSNFNVYDPSASLNADMKDRPAGDGFSDRASTVGARSGQASFKVDLHGDGAGGVPPWADRFLPACGFVRQAGSNTFRPVSAPPAENGSPDLGVRTLSLAVFEDGRRKLLRGCMGTFKIMLETGKDAYLDFSFQGAWGGVVDAPLPNPSYPPQLPLRFAAATLDDGGFEPCIQKLEIDFGGNVVLRECQKASDASGFRGGLVTGRKIVGTLDPEAQLVAVSDPFGDWIEATERTINVSFGDGTDTVSISIPRAQNTNVAGDAERNGIRTDPITWQANRQAVVDDEFSLTFA